MKIKMVNTCDILERFLDTIRTALARLWINVYKIDWCKISAPFFRVHVDKMLVINWRGILTKWDENSKMNTLCKVDTFASQ
jgi:hypothetical protein